MRAAPNPALVSLPQQPRRVAGQMNRWESAYAAHLEMLQAAGEVTWWAFETVKIVLAPGKNVSYLPDFCVVRADGRLEFVEVKGHERTTGIVKFKMAAERLPWARFTMVRKRGEGWERMRELNP